MYGKKVIVVTLCALLLFGTLAFASVSLGQQKVLADEAIFYSTASDGMLSGHDQIYTNAHVQPDADARMDAFTYNYIGQRFIGAINEYYIERSALFFHTSSLPDNAVITSATLSLWGSTAVPTTDFNIIVVDGSTLHDPLVMGDYGDLRTQTTSGGAFNTAGYSPGANNDITLNAEGIEWISKTGWTNFGLRGSGDIAGIAPSGTESVGFLSTDNGEHEPELVVTYYVPPASVPTLSQWGMIGMAIVLAAFLVWSIRRRWVISAGKS